MSAIEEVIKYSDGTYRQLPVYEARAELAALHAQAAQAEALQADNAEMIDRLIELEELMRRDDGVIVWTSTGHALAAHPLTRAGAPAPEQEQAG